jgi:hypothetical protein
MHLMSYFEPYHHHAENHPEVPRSCLVVYVSLRRLPRHAKTRTTSYLSGHTRTASVVQNLVKRGVFKHPQAIPNAKPVHIAAWYALSCAASGASSSPRSWSTRAPTRFDCALSTPLKTIVDTLRPIADPSCVIAWNSAPATLCSLGRDTLEMNIVPAANVKSAPRTTRHAEGKPETQYGALGSIAAK